MSTDAFVERLRTLANGDRGALATLRRSLAFDPGTWPAAFRYVEPFLGKDEAAADRRRAAYLTAGLFAMHPMQADGVSFGRAFGALARKRKSTSIESRFLALLSADETELPNRLRQAVSLLKSDGVALDWSLLRKNLSAWNAPSRYVQQAWARDYYGQGGASE
jgi:CRISPR system Cascade subunit CasB